MKAIELTDTGVPEVMHLREIPTPTPQQDEVWIRVAVTGLNFIDLYVREGRYGNELPLTPGQEAAGTVVALGKASPTSMKVTGSHGAAFSAPTRSTLWYLPNGWYRFGKSTVEQSLTCLKARGTLVLYGSASGDVPPFDLMKLASLGSL